MRNTIRRTVLAMVAALVVFNVGSAFAQLPPNAAASNVSEPPPGPTVIYKCPPDAPCPDKCKTLAANAQAMANAAKKKADELATEIAEIRGRITTLENTRNAPASATASASADTRTLTDLGTRLGRLEEQLNNLARNGVTSDKDFNAVRDQVNALRVRMDKAFELLGQDKDGPSSTVDREFTPAMQLYLDARVKKYIDALPKSEPIKQSAGDFLTREQAERMLASAGYIPKRWNIDFFAGLHLGFNGDYNSRSEGRPAGIYKGVKPAGLFGAAIRIRVGWRAEIDFGVEGGPTQHDDLAAYVGGRVGLLFRVLSDSDEDELAHGQLRLGVRGIAATTFVPGASREPWRSTDGSVRGVIWYTFPGATGLGISVEPGYRSGEMKYYLNNAIQIDKFHDFSLAAAVVWSKTL